VETFCAVEESGLNGRIDLRGVRVVSPVCVSWDVARAPSGSHGGRTRHRCCKAVRDSAGGRGSETAVGQRQLRSKLRKSRGRYSHHAVQEAWAEADTVSGEDGEHELIWREVGLLPRFRALVDSGSIPALS